MKLGTPPGARPYRVHPGRFLVVFAAIFLVSFALLLSPLAHPAVAHISRLQVDISAALIHLCGGDVRVEGTVMRAPANGFAVQMRDGCNAISVTLMLWAAVLAFPASWRRKALGLLVGSFAIQAINLLRFITLFYLGQFSMSLFDFAHVYVWESLIMLDTLVVFWLWAQSTLRTHAVHAAQ